METNENIRQENLGIIRQTDFGEFYEQIMEIHQRGEVNMRSYSSFHYENTLVHTQIEKNGYLRQNQQIRRVFIAF